MSRYIVRCTWDDAPHLTEQAKAELLSSIPPYLHDAVMRGMPVVGSGAVYPISETEIRCEDFPIPPEWPRVFGMDVGWKWTAAAWFAKNPDANLYYLYHTYKAGRQEPSVHANAIRAFGPWIPGVIDPAANGRSQKDGFQLLKVYRDLGMNLAMARNSLEGGLMKMWQMLSSGTLKVFASQHLFFEEFRNYRRDGNGNVVKQNDHVLDCFHPDTIVITDRGPVRIADLCGTTGRVLSRNGSWASYYAATKVSGDSAVVRLTFADGSAVICTPDHLFLTPEGWRQAGDMEGRYCHDALSQREAWCLPFERFRGRAKNFRVFGTTCAARISAAAGGIRAAFFTALSGARSMAAHVFPPVSTFTTETATGGTISPPTWSCCPARSTSRGITGESLSRSRHKRERQPQDGTVRMMAGVGTSGTMSESGEASCTSGGAHRVNSAARNLPGRTDRASAPTNARPSIATILAWTTRNVAVWFAAALSWRIATFARERAQSHAALRKCLSVEPAGRSAVYCLTVPGSHAFSIEAGLVVHNCCRYFCLSGMDLMRGPRETAAAGQSREPMELPPGAWMI